MGPPEVTVDVLNGTTRRGLAGTVSAELRARGFVVANVGNAPQATGPATAVVTYPPAALAQAATVGARFPDVQLVEDPAAAVVSVSLGDGYQQLLAEDALAAPVPAAPAGAC
nr:LytR C-terminal domain-containing protein [Kineococcus aurantiacus]